jgi:hypothetical protein
MTSYQRLYRGLLHDKSVINNEYSDFSLKKERITRDTKAIRRSLSVHNDKAKPNAETATNWMRHEPTIVKHQQPLKQMFGTCCNWKIRDNYRDSSLEIHPTNNQYALPDIHRSHVISITKKRRKVPAPTKYHNKTFEKAKKKDIENELSFHEQGIGYHITRKCSNMNAQFVDKFKDRLNLMLYDFNGFNKKKESSPPPVFYKNKSSCANNLYQKTLSYFNCKKAINTMKSHGQESPKLDHQNLHG